ncbi:glycosyltransferase family 4 protein [Flexithrix dorotheae]|uniref:glycosyltransferase family 4 protein n=1 Tax=Flexithrix dorotheae TaxID=70993 RepID=UPI00037A11F5|nr:glycosyltransferase family 4 protein [Flexithrix dorotheae]
MKVLFLTHYTKLYGANRSLINLIEGLRAFDVEGIVLSPGKGDLTEELKEKQIPFKIASFHTELYYMRGFSRLKGFQRHILNKLAYPKIKQIIKEINPNIIHTNTSGLHIGCHIAYELSIPHIWHIREFGELDYRQKFNLGRKNYLKWINRSDGIIAISEAIKNVALADVNHRVEVIYNGTVFKSKIPPIKRDNKTERDGTNFGIIGSLQPEKGQETAILAFQKIQKEFPFSKLKIFGDSAVGYDVYLKDLVEELHIENSVEFKGYVPKPSAIYDEVDIVLMCSKNEGMGRVTVEAMSYGKPVIGFRGGATPELIEDGINGFLFESETELYAMMKKFMNNPGLITSMGENGQKSALSRFTIEDYSKQVYEYYLSVIAAKTS